VAHLPRSGHVQPLWCRSCCWVGARGSACPPAHSLLGDTPGAGCDMRSVTMTLMLSDNAAAAAAAAGANCCRVTENKIISFVMFYCLTFHHVVGQKVKKKTRGHKYLSNLNRISIFFH